MIDYAEIPQDAKDYYAALDHEVIAEVYCNDEVLSQIKLHKFVSTSKGKGRKRHRVKEVTLIKYGHNYHYPHRFNWWIAGLELLGDQEDVETKLQEIILGNQAYDMNSLRLVSF